MAMEEVSRLWHRFPGTFQEFDEWFSTEEKCLAYRFNRRKSKARGLLFFQLMEQAVNNCAPVSRQMIVGG